MDFPRFTTKFTLCLQVTVVPLPAVPVVAPVAPTPSSTPPPTAAVGAVTCLLSHDGCTQRSPQPAATARAEKTASCWARRVWACQVRKEGGSCSSALAPDVFVAVFVVASLDRDAFLPLQVVAPAPVVAAPVVPVTPAATPPPTAVRLLLPSSLSSASQCTVWQHCEGLLLVLTPECAMRASC